MRAAIWGFGTGKAWLEHPSKLLLLPLVHMALTWGFFYLVWAGNDTNQTWQALI